MRKGVALVMSGPSGVGKSTLAHRLLKEFPQIGFSISCASRPPRKGEIDGVDYFFISKEEFIKGAEAGKFAEWAVVHDNFYGTPLDNLAQSLNSGRDVLLDIDVQGAAQLAASVPEAEFVFILPPSLEILEKRIRERALDSEKAIESRLKKAVWEIGQAAWYDAVIVNDDLDGAYERLKAAYIAAGLKPGRNSALLSRFCRLNQPRD